MERKDVVSIGDVLRECLEQSQMQDKLDEVRACECFAAVVGDVLAAMCHRPSVRNRVMTISTSNASLRSDLNMRRGVIMQRINDMMQKEVIQELKFV